MKWYKDEEHIGYDRDARKIARKARQDRLDALLARNDSSKALRTIYDEYNDEDIVLSKEELQMVQRIREGRFPHVEVSSCCCSCCCTMPLGVCCRADMRDACAGYCCLIGLLEAKTCVLPNISM